MALIVLGAVGLSSQTMTWGPVYPSTATYTGTAAGGSYGPAGVWQGIGNNALSPAQFVTLLQANGTCVTTCTNSGTAAFGNLDGVSHTLIVTLSGFASTGISSGNLHINERLDMWDDCASGDSIETSWSGNSGSTWNSASIVACGQHDPNPYRALVLPLAGVSNMNTVQVRTILTQRARLIQIRAQIFAVYAQSDVTAATPVATLISVQVAPANPSLTVTDSLQLRAWGTYSDASKWDLVAAGKAVTWSSSNATIIYVGSNGIIAALAPGSATITATSSGVSGSTNAIAVVQTVAPSLCAGGVPTTYRPAVTSHNIATAVATSVATPKSDSFTFAGWPSVVPVADSIITIGWTGHQAMDISTDGMWRVYSTNGGTSLDLSWDNQRFTPYRVGQMIQGTMASLGISNLSAITIEADANVNYNAGADINSAAIFVTDVWATVTPQGACGTKFRVITD